ncbi:hypothetical protein GGF32_000859 [Allomyces javanicus]|nr:hypothetical protein GGF32_000859 [Allomyces javanicus]
MVSPTDPGPASAARPSTRPASCRTTHSKNGSTVYGPTDASDPGDHEQPASDDEHDGNERDENVNDDDADDNERDPDLVTLVAPAVASPAAVAVHRTGGSATSRASSRSRKSRRPASRASVASSRRAGHHHHHHHTAPARASRVPPQPFEDLGYRLRETLGEGEFGKVKLAEHLNSGALVAVKLFRRARLQDDDKLRKVQREIAILDAVDHPNIVKLIDVLETNELVGLVIEYASGGELFDYILAHRYLPEPEAGRLFAQLIQGVHYLHSQLNVVHRDLKLENLLLSSSRDLVIIDFGFANQFPPPSPEEAADLWWGPRAAPDRHFMMATSCGSPCYAAPELVVSDGYVGTTADIWSLGCVILFAMLAGYLPFDDDPNNPQSENITLLYKYILTTPTPLHFPAHVSESARHLLEHILVPDPAARYSMHDIMQHHWLHAFRHLFLSPGEVPPPHHHLENGSSVRTSMIAVGSGSVHAPSLAVAPSAASILAAAVNGGDAHDDDNMNGMAVDPGDSPAKAETATSGSDAHTARVEPVKVTAADPAKAYYPSPKSTGHRAPASEGMSGSGRSTPTPIPAVEAVPSVMTLPPSPARTDPVAASPLAAAARSSPTAIPPTTRQPLMLPVLPRAPVSNSPRPVSVATPPVVPLPDPDIVPHPAAIYGVPVATPSPALPLPPPPSSLAGFIASDMVNLPPPKTGRPITYEPPLPPVPPSVAPTSAASSISPSRSASSSIASFFKFDLVDKWRAKLAKRRESTATASSLARNDLAPAPPEPRKKKEKEKLPTKILRRKSQKDKRIKKRALSVEASMPRTSQSPAVSPAVSRGRPRTRSTGASVLEHLRRRSLSMHDSVYEKTEIPPLPPLPMGAPVAGHPYVSAYADMTASPVLVRGMPPAAGPKDSASSSAAPSPTPSVVKLKAHERLLLKGKRFAGKRFGNNDRSSMSSNAEGSPTPPLSEAYFRDVLPRAIHESALAKLPAEAFTMRSPELALFEARKVLEGLGAVIVGHEYNLSTGVPGHGEGRFMLKCRLKLKHRRLTKARLKAELETLHLVHAQQQQKQQQAVFAAPELTPMLVPLDATPALSSSPQQRPARSPKSRQTKHQRHNSTTDWLDAISVRSAYSTAPPQGRDSPVMLPSDYPPLPSSSPAIAALGHPGRTATPVLAAAGAFPERPASRAQSLAAESGIPAPSPMLVGAAAGSLLRSNTRSSTRPPPRPVSRNNSIDHGRVLAGMPPLPPPGPPVSAPSTTTVERVLLSGVPHAAEAANRMFLDGTVRPTSLHYSAYYSPIPTMAATSAVAGTPVLSAALAGASTPKVPKSPMLRKLRSMTFKSDLVFTIEIFTLPSIKGVHAVVMHRTKGSTVAYARVRAIVWQRLYLADEKIQTVFRE